MRFFSISCVYAADDLEPDKLWNDPNKAAGFKSIEVIFSNILGVVTALAGLAVFVMLIVGGFNLLTSEGDPEKIKKATTMITTAIVGLALLIGSWFIMRLIEEFTGVKITVFSIPGL